MKRSLFLGFAMLLLNVVIGNAATDQRVLKNDRPIARVLVFRTFPNMFAEFIALQNDTIKCLTVAVRSDPTWDPEDLRLLPALITEKMRGACGQHAKSLLVHVDDLFGGERSDAFLDEFIDNLPTAIKTYPLEQNGF